MYLKTLNEITKEERDLREILIKYSHGTPEEKEEILKNSVFPSKPEDKINLSDYEAIVNQPGYNKSYKRLYDELCVQAKQYKIDHEMEYMVDFAEQQNAQAIINSLKCYNNYEYNPRNRIKKCTLEELENVDKEVVFYMNSDKVAQHIKDILKSLKQDINKLLNNYSKCKNKPMEQEFKALIATYTNGDKEKVFKEILENERKYYRNYSLADEGKISIVTRNELEDILPEYQEFKKGLQRKIALKALCYFYDIDSKIDGEFYHEYMEIYKAYLSYGPNIDYTGISDEQKEKITIIVDAISKFKEEQYKILLRGYDEEALTCVNNLLNKYKENKTIAYASPYQLAFGKKRIPTWDISTYIIKFRNDQKLSEEDYEIYRKFAKRYGYPILSWIILESNINDTKDENSISVDEIIGFCKAKHRTENNPVSAEIKKTIRLIKQDKSLKSNEIEEILKKVEVFNRKYEKAQTDRILKTYGLDLNSLNQLAYNLSNPEYLINNDSKQNENNLNVLKQIYETTKSEDIKTLYVKAQEAAKKVQKENNEKYRAQVYMSIKANFKKIADLIIGGVAYVNGKNRPFDLIDYHQITTLSYEEIEKIGIADLDAKQRAAWNQFKSKNNYSLDYIGDKRLQEIMNSRSIVNPTIKNGRIVPGTGRLLTDEEKTAILNYLKAMKKVPYTINNYNTVKKRYLKGYLEEELLEKTEIIPEKPIEKAIGKK